VHVLAQQISPIVTALAFVSVRPTTRTLMVSVFEVRIITLRAQVEVFKYVFQIK